MSAKQAMPVIFLALCMLAATIQPLAADTEPQKPIRRLLQQDNDTSSISPIQPRLDLVEIDAMDRLEPYRVMMLLAWHEFTTSPSRSSNLSYWRLAGVHGKSWSYAGLQGPSTGFCKHQDTGFGPWHRAYLKQFENGLIAAGEAAASRFNDPALKAQYTSVAKTIRLPYWDWTKPVVPDLLTATRVTVLDEDGNPIRIRNPLGSYEFVSAAGDGRNAGHRVSRGTRWDQIMSQSARRFGMEIANFVRSNNWRCTYLTGTGCQANLEGTHNEIHSILGGSAGEMSTQSYAAFDSVFWLHHTMVDRILWIFQNNGGQWAGRSVYSPFENLGGDAAQIASYGYTYTNGRLDVPRRRFPRLSSSDVDAPGADGTTGATVGSAAARAAVKVAMQEWTGNYTGYNWAIRFPALNQHQRDRPVHIYVYLKRPGAAVEAMPTSFEDMNDLRLRPNFCGSVAGFNDHVHAEDGPHVLARAVDITGCLQQAGIDPAVAPSQPDDPSHGPSKVPVKVADLRLVAVTANGDDVSSSYDFGQPVISWSVPVIRTVGQMRAAGENDPVQRVAMSAPTAFKADDEVYASSEGDVLEA